VCNVPKGFFYDLSGHQIDAVTNQDLMQELDEELIVAKEAKWSCLVETWHAGQKRLDLRIEQSKQ
jgi:hypothetical protein